MSLSPAEKKSRVDSGELSACDFGPDVAGGLAGPDRETLPFSPYGPGSLNTG